MMDDRINLFKELGTLTTRSCTLLVNDQEMSRLVHYMEDDPLSPDLPDLPPQNKMNELSDITVIPIVITKDLKQCRVVVSTTFGAVTENDQFSGLVLSIEIYTPMDKWLINDLMLRPYAIMNRTWQLLNRTRPTSMGELLFNEYRLDAISDTVTKHIMTFYVVATGGN